MRSDIITNYTEKMSYADWEYLHKMHRKEKLHNLLTRHRGKLFSMFFLTITIILYFLFRGTEEDASACILTAALAVATWFA